MKLKVYNYDFMDYIIIIDFVVSFEEKQQLKQDTFDIINKYDCSMMYGVLLITLVKYIIYINNNRDNLSLH